MLDHMLEFYQVFGLISLGISCPDHQDPLLPLKKNNNNKRKRDTCIFSLKNVLFQSHNAERHDL